MIDSEVCTFNDLKQNMKKFEFNFCCGLLLFDLSFTGKIISASLFSCH